MSDKLETVTQVERVPSMCEQAMIDARTIGEHLRKQWHMQPAGDSTPVAPSVHEIDVCKVVGRGIVMI